MAVIKDRQLTKSFRASEFRCRCRRPECDAPEMDPDFMRDLQALRDLWGKPLKPTSGARCWYWNAKIGGADLSQHPLGVATDFWFESPVDTKRFVELAEKVGFVGIGWGSHLVHLDKRNGPKARWRYPGQ